VVLTMAHIYLSLNKKAEALALLDSTEPIIIEKLGKGHLQYGRCQRIRMGVQALQDSPSQATVASPGTQNAATDTPPSSQNAPRQPRSSGVRRLIARVRERLS
jgi:hypothetical protein